MKKIAFTGYSGFIGHHFGDLLEDKKTDSLALLRSNKIANFKEKEGSNLTFIRFSQSEEDIINALKKYDIMVHIAGKAHIKGAGSKDYKAFVPDNIDLSLRVANLCAKAGVKKFIFISSIGVNGYTTTNVSPFSAIDIPNPHTAYAQSKCRAEEALKEFCKEHNMTLVIIRPPLVYAKNAPGNIATLKKALSYNIPLPFKLIANKRSIIHIDDLCEAILDACEETTWDHAVMLPISKTYSTSDIVKMIAKDNDITPSLFSLSPKILKLIGKITGKSYMIEQLIGDLEIQANWHKNLEKPTETPS